MNQIVMDKQLEYARLGPVRIAYCDEGEGEPVLCIHGSWDDHNSWNGVVDNLQSGFRVISYDRRGHSASTAPPGQGRLSEDVNDALELMDKLGLDSAHIVGHSYGANVAIALASTAPDRTQSLFIHEPPVFSLLKGTPENEAIRSRAATLMRRAADLLSSGETEQGARLFIEKVAFGRGSWENLFDEPNRTVILSNSDTWLDQYRDPERLAIDVTRLRGYPNRITLSTGTATLPAYRVVTESIAAALPDVVIATVADAGHGAHISHPDVVADAIRAHLSDT